MDLGAIHSAYLIGIKGVGMTALAQVLQARGIHVSGSDTAEHFFTQEVLNRAGIPYSESFAAENVPEVDVVIRSTAYGTDHVEVAAAIDRAIPVFTYPESLAVVFNAASTRLAVCGSHGKTTTTAMLGYVLAETGRDPTVIVGSDVPQFGGNARIGCPDLVVVEADEYQDKLRHLNPTGIILTNVDYDHPDFYRSPEEYAGAFRRFVVRIPPEGFIAVCADDAEAMRVAAVARCAVIPYGFRHPPAPPLQDGGGETEGVGVLQLRVPGRHNIQNALGVLAAAEQLGVPREQARTALATFEGTKRRFEVVGEARGATVIDDYAHHPAEIRATLAAARERYPGRRILVAFHAHTYSRTIALKDDFAAAFVGSARTFIMDIFGSARERDQRGITAPELAAAVRAHSPAEPSGGVKETIAALARTVEPGDVVLCLGAGRNDEVARGIVAARQRTQ